MAIPKPWASQQILNLTVGRYAALQIASSLSHSVAFLLQSWPGCYKCLIDALHLMANTVNSETFVGSVGTAFVSEDKGGCIGTGHRLWLCFALSVMSHFWSCVILPGRTLIDKYKSGSWRRDGDGWSESMPKLEKELVATVTVHHSSYPADWIHKLCFMWLCLAWASLATLTMGRRVGHQTENSPTNTTAHTHTLDKNGSLYDPAGTESWNMQEDRKQIY